jgi:hypothetical protein
MQSVVIHAHFYQPPREDPWLDVVPREHSAAPWHDWNARITSECYLPVSAARIQGPGGRITRIVNLFEQISFDVGPTLLSWLEREAPEVLEAIRAADAASRARLGFGNAIAMPYHHAILPLASRRDKVTEVRWGVRDFVRRFGREPEGMWLPETAADQETLDVLAEEGIRFTILAPHQVQPVPLHGLPAWVRTSGGRRLAVFAYDGDVAHDVAFGPLLRDAEAWARRMRIAAGDVRGPRLLSIATDGETYGHHHRFAEMALAAMLARLEAEPDLEVENYASFLARHPPQETVELVAPGSWSCTHGVERWRSDCGCRMEPDTSQAWRAPLRSGLEWLRNRLDLQFEAEAGPLLGDVWAARDTHDPAAAAGLPVRARELLEMQWQARRMFSSCGWFFDDVARLEPLMVLRSAARAIELAGDPSGELRAGLTTWLREARSNDRTKGDGAQILEQEATPSHPAELRAAAGLAALVALFPRAVPSAIGTCELIEATRGAVRVRHLRTGRESAWQAEVHRDSVVHLEVRIAPADGSAPPRVLGYGDLPEPVRETIRAGSQARLLAAVLDDGERLRLAGGVTRLPEALEQAMLRHLGPEPGASDVVALVAAVDLLALMGAPVPFRVQTHYYRHYLRATPAERHRLEPLRERFGFGPIAPPA